MVDAEVARLGYKAGIKKASKAERLGWALKGSPRRAAEKALNVVQAVAEGRRLAQTMAEKLKAARLPAGDGGICAVFGNADLSKSEYVGFPVSDDKSDLQIIQKFQTWIPLGYLVFVLDREKKQFIGHVRPLRLDESALQHLEAQLERAQDEAVKGMRAP
jgi:hypothetical protein